MKRVGSLLILLLFVVFAVSYSAPLKVSVEFYGAKLGTAVDALSKLTNKNIVWDTSAVKFKDTPIYVSIRKPMNINRVFREILKENGLTFTIEGGIYKISKAEELFYTVPNDIIKYIGKDVYSSLIGIVKSNTSPTAEIKEYPSTYSIYIMDTKDNVETVKKLIDAYVKPLSEEAKKIAELKKKEEEKRIKEAELEKKIIKKELVLSHEEFKEIEDDLIQTISEYGRYEYNPTTKKLIIWEIRNNIPKLSKIIAKVKKIDVSTKCFYVRSLEPEELLLNIKENYLSKFGSLVFKSKEASQVVGAPGASNTGNTGNTVNQGQTTLRNNTGFSSRVITSLPKICVTDKPEVIKKLKDDFVGILLERPYQISIEARIVEIESNFTRSLGIQWGGNYQNFFGGTTIYSISSGFAGSNYIFDFPAANVIAGNGMAIGVSLFGGLNRLDINLTALEDIGKSRVLSRPKVITIDGEPAEISQGVEVPYQSTSANFGTNVQFKEALLRLSVTPRTLPDGNIVMTITLTQDVPDFGKAVNGQPPINTKSITSKVVAKDGATIVIGGILEKRNSTNTKGVPFVHRIPIFGWLFKSNLKVVNEKELLIFISPKIIYE